MPIISRRALKEAVTGFSKIIANHTTLPILSGVKFENSGSKLFASCTDLDQYADYALNDVSDEHPFIIGFQAVKDLSKGASDDMIEFTISSKNKVSVVNPVAGQVMTLELPTMDLADWPTQNVKIKTEPVDDFLAVYQRLAPFASTEETRVALNACYLEVADKGAVGKSCMVATDGRRLTMCNSMTLPLRKSCIVPTNKFMAWLKGSASIGVSATKDSEWFALECGQWRYFRKATVGTFPNYRQVIPVEPGHNKITLCEKDAACISQILKALPGSDDDAVIFRGNANVLTLSGKGADDRKETTIELKNSQYDGSAPHFAACRRYILDAIKAGFRTFTFEDEISPLVSSDGHGGKHVLMPLRVGTAPNAPVEAAASGTAEAVTPVPVIPIVIKPEIVAQVAQPSEKHEPKKEVRKMAKTEAVIDKLQAAYETAKDKLREAANTLGELASLIKEAAREDKQRRTEVENVRSSLAKIQSIKV